MASTKSVYPPSPCSSRRGHEDYERIARVSGRVPLPVTYPDRDAAGGLAAGVTAVLLALGCPADGLSAVLPGVLLTGGGNREDRLSPGDAAFLIPLGTGTNQL